MVEKGTRREPRQAHALHAHGATALRNEYTAMEHHTRPSLQAAQASEIQIRHSLSVRMASA